MSAANKKARPSGPGNAIRHYRGHGWEGKSPRHLNYRHQTAESLIFFAKICDARPAVNFKKSAAQSKIMASRTESRAFCAECGVPASLPYAPFTALAAPDSTYFCSWASASFTFLIMLGPPMQPPSQAITSMRFGVSGLDGIFPEFIMP